MFFAMVLAPSLKIMVVTNMNYMKKIIICTAIFLSAAVFKEADAQVRFNVNFNVNSQPVWGPTGYDHVDYYYLPDIESYYYVPTHQFVYLSGNRWVFSASLPQRYRGYDLYSGYKVVVNRPNAYRYFNDDRVRYNGYRGNRSQAIIRNSNDSRYFGVKGHPRYDNRDDHDRGNRDHDHGRGHDRHDR
jgi:hypothetical protein